METKVINAAIREFNKEFNSIYGVIKQLSQFKKELSPIFNEMGIDLVITKKTRIGDISPYIHESLKTFMVEKNQDVFFKPVKVYSKTETYTDKKGVEKRCFSYELREINKWSAQILLTLLKESSLFEQDREKSVLSKF